MPDVNCQKVIWEGWTVEDFIRELQPSADEIMSYRPFKTKAELKVWCMDNQPYYKKAIPDVVAYFAQRYQLR